LLSWGPSFIGIVDASNSRGYERFEEIAEDIDFFFQIKIVYLQIVVTIKEVLKQSLEIDRQNL